MTEYFIYIGGGLLALCFLLILAEHIRLSRMIKKYKLLIKGLSEKNIEDLMVSYSDELAELKHQVNGNIISQISSLEGKMTTCLRNIGLVSYNAFENVGNNMSFSLAALDDKKNGLVLTGIYTRENSYVYSKEVSSGQPNKELSKEEKEALSKALSNIKQQAE
jgi:hypothetical protein